MEIETHESTRKVKFEAIVLWAIAIIAVLLGIILSTIPIMDRYWLARAGAVVVMIGIWSGIGGIFRYAVIHERLNIKKRRAEMQAQSKYQNDPEELKQLLSDIYQQYNNDVDGYRSKLSISVGIQEATLLLIGTFLWGFGDLFHYLFKS